MSRIYEFARNTLLDLIAYKFEVRAQFDEALFGVTGHAHRAAKDLSRAVADEYSGRKMTDSKAKELEHSVAYAGFE